MRPIAVHPDSSSRTSQFPGKGALGTPSRIPLSVKPRAPDIEQSRWWEASLGHDHESLCWQPLVQHFKALRSYPARTPKTKRPAQSRGVRGVERSSDQSSAVIERPRVSGSIQTIKAPSVEKTAPSESVAPKPNRAPSAAIMIGVKN